MMTLMKIINAEVYYPANPLVSVSFKDIKFLKQKTLENQRRRARLCTHLSPSDNLHEMLILHTNDTYVRPHKHIGKVESLFVIEGNAIFVVFNDSGNITYAMTLGDYLSGKTFYCRISEPCFHTLIITSEILVFHEVTNGPFLPSDTLYAQWSPEPDDDDGIRQYLSKLNMVIGNYRQDII